MACAGLIRGALGEPLWVRLLLAPAVRSPARSTEGSRPAVPSDAQALQVELQLHITSVGRYPHHVMPGGSLDEARFAERAARASLYRVDLPEARRLAEAVPRLCGTRPPIRETAACVVRSELTLASVLKHHDALEAAADHNRTAHRLALDRFGLNSSLEVAARLAELHTRETERDHELALAGLWNLWSALDGQSWAAGYRFEALTRILAIGVKTTRFAEAELALRRADELFDQVVGLRNTLSRYWLWEGIYDIKRHRYETARVLLDMSSSIVTSDQRIQIVNKFPYTLLQAAEGDPAGAAENLERRCSEAEALGMARNARAAREHFGRHQANASGV